MPVVAVQGNTRHDFLKLFAPRHQPPCHMGMAQSPEHQQRASHTLDTHCDRHTLCARHTRCARPGTVIVCLRPRCRGGLAQTQGCRRRRRPRRRRPCLTGASGLLRARLRGRLAPPARQRGGGRRRRRRRAPLLRRDLRAGPVVLVQRGQVRLVGLPRRGRQCCRLDRGWREAALARSSARRHCDHWPRGRLGALRRRQRGSGSASEGGKGPAQQCLGLGSQLGPIGGVAVPALPPKRQSRDSIRSESFG